MCETSTVNVYTNEIGIIVFKLIVCWNKSICIGINQTNAWAPEWNVFWDTYSIVSIDILHGCFTTYMGLTKTVVNKTFLKIVLIVLWKGPTITCSRILSKHTASVKTGILNVTWAEHLPCFSVKGIAIKFCHFLTFHYISNKQITSVLKQYKKRKENCSLIIIFILIIVRNPIMLTFCLIPV